MSLGSYYNLNYYLPQAVADTSSTIIWNQYKPF